MHKPVYDPKFGPEAFKDSEDSDIQSQAANLLLLGLYVRENYPMGGKRGFLNTYSKRDQIREAINPLRVLASQTKTRVPIQHTQTNMVKRYGAAKMAALSRHAPQEKIASDKEICYDLVQRLYAQPDVDTASEVLEYFMYNESDLLRVAAAASNFDLSDEPQRVIPVLAAATSSPDTLARDIAATVLARIAPQHPRVLALSRGASTQADGTPSNTSLLVHGTWAKQAAWWHPGGDFHTYLLNHVRRDLYNRPDRFDWSGGYSHEARVDAAEEFIAWTTAKQISSPDVFTHSHGGSAVMLASHRPGLKIKELVLLSCPVHLDRYFPNFSNIQKTVSIRVRLDLVILADFGGQKFKHPNIEENVLPIWFDHAATHEEQVWVDHNVPNML
ncbi:MAG: alpha/beta hydrolase [Anaerolineae bacterium]|nr:alpha/beta hydrolase [Anaerolineae bacterium]